MAASRYAQTSAKEIGKAFRLERNKTFISKQGCSDYLKSEDENFEKFDCVHIEITTGVKNINCLKLCYIVIHRKKLNSFLKYQMIY